MRSWSSSFNNKATGRYGRVALTYAKTPEDYTPMRPASANPQPRVDGPCEHHAVEPRALLLNLVTALLIVGGVLLLMSWTGPSMDPGMAMLGFVLAALHFAAALGTALRRRWGRLVGLVVGGIGLFGTGTVLVTLAAALQSVASSPVLEGESWLSILLIPAVMVAAYLAIVVVLLRNGAAFDGELSGQLG